MAIISNAVTIADAGAFSVSLGSLVHIKTLTASSSATLSFVHGTADVVLDSTYPIYKFEFINMHPQNSGANALFEFQGSTNSGSSYGVAITSTTFFAYHDEADSITSLTYDVNSDQANGTVFQDLANRTHNDNDSSMVGTLEIFNPSSSVFVKHFIADCNAMHEQPMSLNHKTAGYFNTTSAIDAIQFKFNTGNIDSGTIKLYGIKDS